MEDISLQRRSNDLSAQSETSLTASQQRLAVEINLTAINSKLEVQSELAAEFVRVFDSEPPEAIQWAFREWRLQSSFFPAIADIAKLISQWHGGVDQQDQKKIEANAAWNYVNEYLGEWGADRLPVYSGGGQKTSPPPLDARTEYALRRIGGLRALNHVDLEKMPFMYRDFCEAYSLAPMAESMAPLLAQQFSEQKLLGEIKQLAKAKTIQGEKLPGKSPKNAR